MRNKDPDFLKLEAKLVMIDGEITRLNMDMRALERERDRQLKVLNVGDLVEYRELNTPMGRTAPDIVTRGVITSTAQPWPTMQVFAKDGTLTDAFKPLYRALKDDYSLTVLKRVNPLTIITVKPLEKT